LREREGLVVSIESATSAQEQEQTPFLGQVPKLEQARQVLQEQE
jgi:hypothetical protein